MHIRQQIRNKFTEILKTISEFDDRVYESRVHQLAANDMPCALVFSESETLEAATRSSQPYIQKRTVETSVYAFARSAELVENSIDALTSSIEEKIFADPTLGGLVSQTILQSTILHIDGQPNSPIGAARMSFISTVHTREGIPQTQIK